MIAIASTPFSAENLARSTHSIIELDPTCEITDSFPLLTSSVAIQADIMSFFSVREREAYSAEVPFTQSPFTPVATRCLANGLIIPRFTDIPSAVSGVKEGQNNPLKGL